MSDLAKTLSDRFKKLDEFDKLLKLDHLIDWEIFRPTLEKVREKPRKSNGGRKPHDVVLMFKMLIIQRLYNLSDEQVEFQVRDRWTFLRFVGISHDGIVPDAKSVWLFKEQLKQLNLVDHLFDCFEDYLQEQGYHPKSGQIIDASFVEVPKQRNSKEENAQIKKGNTPDTFTKSEHKLRQKDVDARWTKKNSKSYYGYKNHINIDNDRTYALTM